MGTVVTIPGDRGDRFAVTRRSMTAWACRLALDPNGKVRSPDSPSQGQFWPSQATGD
jgi:hypothetical protein